MESISYGRPPGSRRPRGGAGGGKDPVQCVAIPTLSGFPLLPFEIPFSPRKIGCSRTYGTLDIQQSLLRGDRHELIPNRRCRRQPSQRFVQPQAGQRHRKTGAAGLLVPTGTNRRLAALQPGRRCGPGRVRQAAEARNHRFPWPVVHHRRIQPFDPRGAQERDRPRLAPVWPERLGGQARRRDGGFGWITRRRLPERRDASRPGNRTCLFLLLQPARVSRVDTASGKSPHPVTGWARNPFIMEIVFPIFSSPTASSRSISSSSYTSCGM